MSCRMCGSPYEIHRHHKVNKGMGGGKGYDFPGNLVELCWLCHKIPHQNRKVDLQFKREVRDFLWDTLTETHYMPEDLVKILKLPRVQAYRVIKMLRPDDKGYRKEDIIFRLLGDRHDWREDECATG